MPSSRSSPPSHSLATHPIFIGLSVLTALALLVSFVLVVQHDTIVGIPVQDKPVLQEENEDRAEAIPPLQQQQAQQDYRKLTDGPPHLYPPLDFLPPFENIPGGPQAEKLKKDVISGENPTIAGIAALLNDFLVALHERNKENAKLKADVPVLRDAYFELAQKYLIPTLEEPYVFKRKPYFPIREDNSIFISLAAFREHLLSPTLQSAFSQADNPDKLFIGAVIQNCFGIDVQCRTGLQVIGKNAQGRDMVKMSDAPPDVNGVAEFCALEDYSHYCTSGQLRVLYVNETDSLGPAVARYYASKLWGGETFFLQMDSHLEFAPHWDTKYIQEIQLAKSYPKAILSSYPPGFQNFGTYKGGTPGARLCHCEFSTSEVENKIIRINTGGRTPTTAPKPTQIAYMAAGFFFARAEFLVDVPFDPLLPWCFMGEEIALSIRSWTSGWNMYAPRQNLIAHQYRPGRLGLPKFWESVGRDSGRPNLNTRMQKHVIRRVKYLVGYPEETREVITADGDGLALLVAEHYGLGSERTREAYLELTQIDMVEKKCHSIPWCNDGELE